LRTTGRLAKLRKIREETRVEPGAQEPAERRRREPARIPKRHGADESSVALQRERRGSKKGGGEEVATVQGHRQEV
jgi:hypothetical protein